MASILFVTADKERFELARETFAADYPDVALMFSPPEGDGSDIAAAVAAHGAEVVISRGVTYTRVKNMGLPVAVLEAPVTALDNLHALKQARAIGRRIAAVGSPSLFTGAEELAQLMSVDLSIHPLIEGVPARSLVEEAVRDGAEVIISGFLGANIARDIGLPSVIIDNRSSSLIRAAEDAAGIVAAVRSERSRSGIFRALLDNSNDGIIATDNEGRVIVCNPVAERISGVTGAVGEHCDERFAELGLTETMRTGREELGAILRLPGPVGAGVDVVCNKVPVMARGKAVAVVATFQDVGRIQQIEAKVRSRIYETGHAANATFDGMQATSTTLLRTITKAKEFALTDSSVLLLGETGTGKELFAQSMHNYSSRKKGPFVAINCAALPGQLLESELFGYAGGAFTGANPKGKPGMFELAHGGTLLLDEIAEMDMLIQGKLLRVLEERKIIRLGSDRVLPVDVRLITATNKNLHELVLQNAFRADLYYRLNVLRLRLPPLRERPEDIAPLAAFFLRSFAAKGQGKSALHLSQEAGAALQHHHWPGNARELRNLMERIAALHKQGRIDADTIDAHLAEEAATSCGQADNTEMQEIYNALAECGGNYTKTAKLLGVSRITLWRKLRRKN